jgi:fructokinase
MQKIWQQSTVEMSPEHPAWDLQANIVGQFCHNLLLTLSAERIILGGGVMQQPFLLDKIIAETQRNLNGYLSLPDGQSLSEIIVTPGLSTESGLLGALALVEPE